MVESTLDRATLWAVQTPQGFRAALLREAHEKARRDGIVGTDDAMLVERLGHPVRVVPGLAEQRQDHHAGRSARGPEAPVNRVGFGFDLHPLVAGRPLILGGVTVPRMSASTATPTRTC